MIKARKTVIWRAVSGALLVALACTVMAPIVSGQVERSQSASLLAAQSEAAATYSVTADTAEIRMACPGGLVDPLDPDIMVAPGDIWVPPSSSMTQRALDGGGVSLVPDDGALAAELSSGVFVAGTQEREYRSLIVNNCQIARAQVAVVGGSTVIGEDTIVTIANPGPQSTDVHISAFGAAGALEELVQPLTIPAETTVSFLPAVWFPDEERLALVLTSDGDGISAWLQASGRDGEVPQGLSRVGARPLDTRNDFPAVSEAWGQPVVSLMNPTDDPLAISLHIANADGVSDLPGTEDLIVDPGAVFDVSLKGIGSDVVSLIALADQPFAASISYQIAGAKDPVVQGATVIARSIVSPAEATTSVEFPSTEELLGGRDGGLADGQVTLAVSNPGDVAVTVAGVRVEPGTMHTWTGKDVEALGGSVVADIPVYFALHAAAMTDLGPVGATTDLGLSGIEEITRQVTLTP